MKYKHLSEDGLILPIYSLGLYLDDLLLDCSGVLAMTMLQYCAMLSISSFYAYLMIYHINSIRFICNLTRVENEIYLCIYTISSESWPKYFV